MEGLNRRSKSKNRMRIENWPPATTRLNDAKWCLSSNRLITFRTWSSDLFSRQKHRHEWNFIYPFKLFSPHYCVALKLALKVCLSMFNKLWVAAAVSALRCSLYNIQCIYFCAINNIQYTVSNCMVAFFKFTGDGWFSANCPPIDLECRSPPETLFRSRRLLKAPDYVKISLAIHQCSKNPPQRCVPPLLKSVQR